MSGGERKLADTKGKFVQVVKNGSKVNNLEWLSGRIILSNRRLVLVSSEGKQTIALSSVKSMKNRKNVNEAISPVAGYFSLQCGADVHLVAPSDLDDFEEHIYTALLDQEGVLVKHPAVEGGVVQDTQWQKGRVNIDRGEVDLAVASGQFVEVELSDVGAVDMKKKSVKGSTRRVLEVEHTLEAGTSVETHISGTARHMAILESLVRQGELENTADVDLEEGEHEVLMALYSGVSPFEIPSFVDRDVDEVEEIYNHLIDEGILEKVRSRREVLLKARGRNIASEVISDQ